MPADLSGLLEPINPLLLVTAIATALVKGEDGCAMLERYADGSPLEGTYATLLRLPAYTDELLAEQLRIESELVEHFCVLSLSSGAAVRIENPDSLSADAGTWRDQWLRLDANAEGGDWSAAAARDAVRWGTWLLANPVLFSSPIASVQLLLWEDGMAHNDQIHVAREEMEQLAPHRDAQFNALLRRNLPVDIKRTALRQARAERALAALALARARRFYIWNPLEIDARRASARFMAVFLEEKARRTDEGKAKDCGQ